MELGSLLVVVGKVQMLVVHKEREAEGLNIDEIVVHVVLHMGEQMEHSLLLVYWSLHNA